LSGFVAVVLVLVMSERFEKLWKMTYTSPRGDGGNLAYFGMYMIAEEGFGFSLCWVSALGGEDGVGVEVNF
jgi:hypothetical protein